MNRLSWGCGAAAAALLLACSSNAGPGDMAVDDDLGPAPDLGSDTRDEGMEGASTGEACDDDSDCRSEICVDVLGAFDLGEGYCSLECEEDRDCEMRFPADGYDHACFGGVCYRSCEDGFGCPPGARCLDNRLIDVDRDVRGDVCVDLTMDECARDSDCEEPEHCVPLVSDREGLTLGCFTFLDGEGEPRTGLLRPGDACNPRSEFGGGLAIACRTTTECPDGWSCGGRPGDGRRVCQPPDDETCGYFCNAQGSCAGICTADDDCPSDMRCSLTDLTLGQGTADDFDDLYVPTGICTYAAGSRTSCAREADCQTTGAGGAREVCFGQTDDQGSYDPICVTPLAGYPLPGEACGDDPATAAFEVRTCATGTGCVGRVCTPGLCTTDADCGQGFSCLDLVTTRTGSRESACFPTSDGCGSDNDCEPGETCSFVSSLGDEPIVTFCLPAGGELLPGERCDDRSANFLDFEDRCTSFCGTEFGGTSTRCSSLCGDDGDCPEGYLCGFFDNTLANGRTALDRADDAVGRIGACEAVPGSRAACSFDSDCAIDEACVPVGFDAAGAPRRVCASRFTTGAEPGEACADNVVCTNRLCVADWRDNSDEFCTELCESTDDCETGFVCRSSLSTDVAGPASPLCIRSDDPRGSPL